VPLAADLLPTASPLSCGLLFIFCTPYLSGPSGEAVAANLEVLAPFEEQRLSLLIFALDIAFLCENNEKSGPIWGPDSGPKTGILFRPLIVINIRQVDRGPILGPESGPKTGPHFCTSVAKKKHLRLAKTTTSLHKNGPLLCHSTASHSATQTNRSGPPAQLQSRGSLAPPALTICAR